MKHTEDEQGIAVVLLQRLSHERIPRLLELKAHVDRGDKLTDYDINFLEQVFRDANNNRQYVAAFPEYSDIVRKVAHLYEAITSKALENERNPTK